MVLQTEDLVKAYRGRRVVDGVSIEVETGEIVGLLGPNGAGKTTTFYMVVGLVRPNGGRVLLEGEDLSRLPMHLRARKGIGYLAQEPSVFRRLTVAENLRLVLEMQHLSAQEVQQRTDELLAELGIEHLRDSKGMVLSGGERRRTEIARALATNPAFVLLDEPFTGVDPIALDDIRDIIMALRGNGIGILLTDHSVRDTLEITDRAYIIHEGRILSSGPSETLPEDPIARRFYFGDRFNI
ncbi:MAG: LPS export ABC transporter ATP-binding protein [Armatimonadota bacterium]